MADERTAETLLTNPHGLLNSSATEAREARARAVDTAELPPEPVESVMDILIPGSAVSIPIRVYKPAATDLGNPRPVLLWLHGGGMVLGGNYVQSDRPVRRIANRVGCIVAAVDFRLAPEHPFPAGVNDCRDALRWIVKNA